MSEERSPSEAPDTLPDSSGPIPEAEITAELQRILVSPEFRTSKRCLQFLKYVVEQTLAGLPNGLKERTIGVEVFDRAVTYDTNVEGIVRIKASEVRKRLTLYYAGSGKDSDLRIELPVGSYVPLFSRSRPQEAEDQTPTHLEEVAPEGSVLDHEDQPGNAGTPLWRRPWALVIPALLLVLGAVLWQRTHRPSVIEDFWAPVMKSPQPVLVAAAYAPVYLSLSETAPTSVKDFSLLKDQYVGGGDLMATAQVVGMLSRMNHPYNLRIGHGVTFEDLRGGPSVLIGYSSTHWSQMTKDLRYYIDDSDQTMVRDGGKPTDWYPDLTLDYQTDEDYAIVARAVLPQTHATMILITGCTQYGTESAANLVTNPDLLAEALRGAPEGWQHMNLELVLKMKVIAHTPATPKVIASHYW